MPPPPVGLALIAADRAARSKRDARCDLTGVFHALALPLPAEVTFAVYFVVTNCHGPADLAVEFPDPAHRVLSGGTYHIPVADPLAVVQGGRRNRCRSDQPARHLPATDH